MSLIPQPIRVNGQSIRALRVHELVSELTAVGVPEASVPGLNTELSALRAQTGPLGSLEYGRSIEDLSVAQAEAEVARRGGDDAALNPHKELRRIVHILTGQSSPAHAPPTPAAPPPVAVGGASTETIHGLAVVAVRAMLPAPGGY